MIHKSFSKFIIRTSQYLEKITTIDLNFKHHKFLYIIIVYLLPNNLPLNQKVSNKAIALINECNTLYLILIIIRDFNINFKKLYHNIYHNIKLLLLKFGLLKRLIN